MGSIIKKSISNIDIHNPTNIPDAFDIIRTSLFLTITIQIISPVNIIIYFTNELNLSSKLFIIRFNDMKNKKLASGGKSVNN